MWIYILIFFLELLNSCIAALRTRWISHNRKWLAPISDIGCEIINLGVGFIIYVETQNFKIGLAAALASGIGTKVAMHLPTPRRKGGRKKKGTPVNI